MSDLARMATIRAFSARAARISLALAASGCGASASFEGGVYRDHDVSFRLQGAPREWRSVRVSDADVVFRDDAHEASVLINGRCIPESADAPLNALTEHLIMGTTDRQFSVEETLAFDAREARHSVLRAKLDGVVMGYDLYVMKKNGCVYDLVYVGDPERMQAGMPAFEQFARGFHTLEGS
jgi:hypothetical protein